jgi:hypothetical protein
MCVPIVLAQVMFAGCHRAIFQAARCTKVICRIGDYVMLRYALGANNVVSCLKHRQTE